MQEVAAKARRLQAQIRDWLDLRDRPADLNRWSKGAADLLLRALEDGTHPVSQLLDELRAAIFPHLALPRRRTDGHRGRRRSRREPPAPTSLVTKDGKPDSARSRKPPPALPISWRNLFLPQPGGGGALRFWPIQLLLYAVGKSGRLAELAPRLELGAYALQQAYEAARLNVVGISQWNGLRFASYLEKSLNLFVNQEDPRTMLTGREFNYRGKKVRLSLQQGILLKLLLDAADEHVTFQQIRSRGVRNPTSTMSKLRQKLGKRGIYLDITSRSGVYVFHSVDAVPSP
jgi:hypothetical protein